MRPKIRAAKYSLYMTKSYKMHEAVREWVRRRLASKNISTLHFHDERRIATSAGIHPGRHSGAARFSAPFPRSELREGKSWECHNRFAVTAYAGWSLTPVIERSKFFPFFRLIREKSELHVNFFQNFWKKSICTWK